MVNLGAGDYVAARSKRRLPRRFPPRRKNQMKFNTWASSALAAFTLFVGIEARADNFVTIIPTGASAATVVNRWAIGSGLSGLSYDDSNSGFAGATPTNFFTITGAA